MQFAEDPAVELAAFGRWPIAASARELFRRQLIHRARDPLARIVRTDRLRVEGYVDAAKWGPEQVRDRPVTVEVPLAGDTRESFTGRIVFVSPLVESGGDYRVFAEVDNRKAPSSQQWLLRAGQTATMTVHARQQPLAPVRREATAAR